LKITSRENQRLKFARKVRDQKISDKIFIEGTRLAEELLRSDLELTEVFISNNFGNNPREKVLIERLLSKNIEIFEVSDKIFKTIAETKTSQGIIIISQIPTNAKETIESNLEKNKSHSPLLILLHNISNPANLGAILRTSEAVGIDGVILTKNSTSPFSPKALRSAMGASFRLPIWKNAEFSEVLDWTKQQNLTSVCADINAEKNYTELDYKIPCLFVFGSEAHGLDQAERNLVEEGVKIPLENEVESLNLAIACGVILFEAKRQRH
jgi:TrmH family RNA methyltransferase